MLKDVLERIEKRLAELDLTAATASRQAGLSPDAIRNMRRKVEAGVDAGVSTRTIQALAPVLGMTPAQIMGNDHEDDAPPTPRSNASFPPRYQRFPSTGSVPLLGQTMSGPNGRFILNGQEVDRLFCPPMLVGIEGAYAVRIYGTSMEPRFFAGETGWINPREPVRAGDDIVAQLLTGEEGVIESYIKRFVSLSAKTLRLYQFNPDEGETHDLEFDADRVFSVHKIVFHAML